RHARLRLRARRAEANARTRLAEGDMAYENLLIERRDVVAIVTVNRPDKLNALNDRTMSELDAAFQGLGEDREVRGVILTGAGEKAFVGGAGLGQLRAQTPV